MHGGFFPKKIIDVQGQISMQGGNFLTNKTIEGEITYMYVQFFEIFLLLATFNWSLTYKMFFIMTICKVLFRYFFKKMFGGCKNSGKK